MIDPSDFDSVTLYSPEGTILYSTATSRIGTQLPGEKDSIKEALRGVPLTSEFDGTLSVKLPLRFRSGVGGPAVVELTHPDAPIASAAGPGGRTRCSSFALLVLLGVAVFGVARLLAVVSDTADGRRGDAARRDPATRAGSGPHPGLREEGEARRRAEERARAAEERLGLLQDQYRTTLEELQSFQQLASETKPARRGRTDRGARVAGGGPGPGARAPAADRHARSASAWPRSSRKRSRRRCASSTTTSRICGSAKPSWKRSA